MVGHPTSNEEAQLAQTIEMFEVITQSQPQDYQSLEILKEAYAKLGREKDVVATSKRIANAYVLMGQLSSAILEYESILQRYPEDVQALAALGEIESKANSLNSAAALAEVVEAPKPAPKSRSGGSRLPQADVDDGRQAMHKISSKAKLSPTRSSNCAGPLLTSPLRRSARPSRLFTCWSKKAWCLSTARCGFCRTRRGSDTCHSIDTKWTSSWLANSRSRRASAGAFCPSIN